MKTLTSFRLTLALALLATAGCATTGSSPSDDPVVAAQKSQVYMERLTYHSAREIAREKQDCTLPAEAQKPAPGNRVGPSREWKKLVGYANACVADRDWKTLESIANAIARTDIDSPWGAYFLSVSAEGSGDYSRAIWMIDLAQKKAGGGSGLFHYQKGHILLQMKDVPAAMTAMKKGLEMDSSLVEGHIFLAQIHNRDVEHDKAAEHYALALKADPRHALALVELAEIKVQKGDTAEAMALYQRALLERPDSLKARLKALEAALGVKQPQQASANEHVETGDGK